MRVAARAVEQRFNADTSDHIGRTAPCACGQSARYAGRHTKTFTSVLGALALERAYYHCTTCQAGFCPRDRALGLEGPSLSPGVMRMVGHVGAMVSFVEGSELIRELAAVAVDAKQVERSAEALGRQIAQDERVVVESEPPSAPTMYLGMDGTGLPMRASELEGREGKQPDGSAKTREVKLVTVWSAEGRDDEGIPVRDQGSVTYSAAIETAATHDTDEDLSPFAQRVDREARRRGFDQARRRVVLGDGATWIWNLADEQFPGAVQVVDLYHAKGHLWDVAKAIYGAGSDLAEQWAKQRRDELDDGKRSLRRCKSTPRPTTTRASAWTTSGATRAACATPSSVPRDCACPPAWSRPAARWPSAPASSVQACIGASPGPTQSSRCAVASSAAASRTSGSDGQPRRAPAPGPPREVI
jgi:hypothetical protein